MNQAQSPKPKKSIRHAAWEWMKSLAVALVIWFVLRTLLVEAFRIPSSSMERTLLVGDFLFVNKALYGAEVPLIHTRLPAVRDPKRGDIVVFDSRTEDGVKVVKRLVGTAGRYPADEERGAVAQRRHAARELRRARRLARGSERIRDAGVAAPLPAAERRSQHLPADPGQLGAGRRARRASIS